MLSVKILILTSKLKNPKMSRKLCNTSPNYCRTHLAKQRQKEEKYYPKTTKLLFRSINLFKRKEELVVSGKERENHSFKQRSKELQLNNKLNSKLGGKNSKWSLTTSSPIRNLVAVQLEPATVRSKFSLSIFTRSLLQSVQGWTRRKLKNFPQKPYSCWQLSTILSFVCAVCPYNGTFPRSSWLRNLRKTLVNPTDQPASCL